MHAARGDVASSIPTTATSPLSRDPPPPLPPPKSQDTTPSDHGVTSPIFNRAMVMISSGGNPGEEKRGKDQGFVAGFKKLNLKVPLHKGDARAAANEAASSNITLAEGVVFPSAGEPVPPPTPVDPTAPTPDAAVPDGSPGRVRGKKQMQSFAAGLKKLNFKMPLAKADAHAAVNEGSSSDMTLADSSGASLPAEEERNRPATNGEPPMSPNIGAQRPKLKPSFQRLQDMMKLSRPVPSETPSETAPEAPHNSSPALDAPAPEVAPSKPSESFRWRQKPRAPAKPNPDTLGAPEDRPLTPPPVTRAPGAAASLPISASQNGDDRAPATTAAVKKMANNLLHTPDIFKRKRRRGQSAPPSPIASFTAGPVVPPKDYPSPQAEPVPPDEPEAGVSEPPPPPSPDSELPGYASVMAPPPPPPTRTRWLAPTRPPPPIPTAAAKSEATEKTQRAQAQALTRKADLHHDGGKSGGEGSTVTVFPEAPANGEPPTPASPTVLTSMGSSATAVSAASPTPVPDRLVPPMRTVTRSLVAPAAPPPLPTSAGGSVRSNASTAASVGSAGAGDGRVGGGSIDKAVLGGEVCVVAFGTVSVNRSAALPAAAAPVAELRFSRGTVLPGSHRDVKDAGDAPAVASSSGASTSTDPVHAVLEGPPPSVSENARGPVAYSGESSGRDRKNEPAPSASSSAVWMGASAMADEPVIRLFDGPVGDSDRKDPNLYGMAAGQSALGPAGSNAQATAASEPVSALGRRAADPTQLLRGARDSKDVLIHGDVGGGGASTSLMGVETGLDHVETVATAVGASDVADASRLPAIPAPLMTTPEGVGSASGGTGGAPTLSLGEIVLWDAACVARMLGKLGISADVVGMLEANNVNGLALLTLTDDRLRAFGIHNATTRAIVLLGAYQLRVEGPSIVDVSPGGAGGVPHVPAQPQHPADGATIDPTTAMETAVGPEVATDGPVGLAAEEPTRLERGGWTILRTAMAERDVLPGYYA
ncbi:hypothetical protein HDU96_005102 [Phlyctochytrium bullatum]|nr:hypothetical protein HDU96_005102 [Phlyctochytrium bullatum]